MEPAYYEIGVIASIPDQEFTSSLNGVVLNMRLALLNKSNFC